MRYKNNPQNIDNYLEFQKRQLELSKQTENEARKMKINSNVEAWENNLPSFLKKAKPSNLSNSILSKIRSANLKPPYEKRMLISSSSPHSSTFVAYSIIHGLIQAGFVTPSEVRSTGLLDGYNNINGMFQSREWKDRFFDKKAKVLLIEGSSKSLTLMGPRGEEQFWRELDDFTRNQDKLVILTYILDNEEIEKKLFIPFLTNEKDLNSKLIRKSVFVSISESEEEQIKNEQR